MSLSREDLKWIEDHIQEGLENVHTMAEVAAMFDGTSTPKAGAMDSAQSADRLSTIANKAYAKRRKR